MGSEFEIFPQLYAMALGFCVASLITAGWQLATGRPLSFVLDDVGNPALAFLSIVLRLVAGPAILVRSALTSRSEWAPVLALVFPAVAVGWSILSGTLMIESLTGVTPVIEQPV